MPLTSPPSPRIYSGIFPTQVCQRIPQPSWSCVESALAQMGLTVEFAGALVRVVGEHHRLAGWYRSKVHVTHVLVSVAARLLTRQLHADVAVQAWLKGNDLQRGAIRQWAAGYDQSRHKGPFDWKTTVHLRRTIAVRQLPHDWLARLPDLVKADFPFTPFAPKLLAALTDAERAVLDSSINGTTSVITRRGRL